MNRIPSLDGFRAIAIILVLISHSRLSEGFPAEYSEFVKPFDVGVTFFFVISGFLITTLLLREEEGKGSISASAFYLRRAFRILPVFFVYLAFVLVWQNIEDQHFTHINLIHVLTFTVNFDAYKNWFLGHFWTLSVEEQFYLIFPLIFVAFRRHLKTIILISVVYSCLVRVLAYKFPGTELISLAPFFSYSDAIAIGILGGIFWNEKHKVTEIKFLASARFQIVCASVIVTVICLSVNHLLAFFILPFGNALISIAFLCIMLANVNRREDYFFKFLNNKTIIHIGLLSYSIYIWQQFFVTGYPFLWRRFPLNLLPIYAFAAASYYLLERPFLRFRQYILLRNAS